MTRDEQLRQALGQRWRQGSKVPKNVYALVNDYPSDEDVDIGRMDSAQLASEVVESHNALLTSTFERGEMTP